ncbi:uncharacterized protein LOC141664415 isoform X2 [Apium graveolens]|uniref:uncharacterized protein LOC141664415 isoform X2 n=1 Tax=Apium graveolens TaxID=4045 RepID=UPI003D7B84D1
MMDDTKRKELLHRWRGIEEEDENDDDDSPIASNKRRRFQQLKENWFSDVFNILIHLPKENHISCGYRDLMGPLLETFYNYFEDKRQDSPLKILWKRISEELGRCTQCICQHHQAQESYSMEYDSISVGPLVSVLQTLDEERVTEHLKELNAKIAQGEYDPACVNDEVVSIMFEIFMYPILLDDQSLVAEFQIFIEAVDNSHELTLAGHQRYPGIYALLFLKCRRARSIGFRLAVHAGKLREASELEGLHPLLKRYIGFLETEVVSSTSKSNRPRVLLERTTIWHGIKSLLGFLEPPAFEEGILEHYPDFLSIVLNHINDDSLEFSYAVNCLRNLFGMLGCKLWLTAILSPSVIHNTLLSQCFHTRNEKSHKDIFDLFQPFLQSLEALQDGEHEKQRRKCLYFLLHQVTVSKNFSNLMRKKACQIALRIVHRGYQMNPPCPPFECAHMWGPSLVSTLRDSSLHSSLQQPAYDLIQTIIVSDAAALIAAMLNRQRSSVRSMSFEFNDEDEDRGLPFALDLDKDISCWNEFNIQGKIATLDSEYWMCMPMLWADVLVDTDPSVLPVSFSKAVFWALSRLSMVEAPSNNEMALPVRHWLTTCASEISHLFGWKVPCSSDDGGDEKEPKNSAKVSSLCIAFVRTFKRLSMHYIVRMDHEELWRQWAWEPRMGESLILLLVEPEDSSRQVARHILEHVSRRRTLGSGLQFLCSFSSSLLAVYLGLKHALKLVQLESVVCKFHTLHNFFFVLCKVLKEGIAFNETLPGSLSDNASTLKFSNDGGFLQQPVFNSISNSSEGHLFDVDLLSWEKFGCLLSAVAWPSILKCLAEGKAFIDFKISQMTCIRLLEIMPIIFERLQPSFLRCLGNLGIPVKNEIDYKWLLDLVDWGKSTLSVVVRYWKQTFISLLDLLKCSCSDKSSSLINAIDILVNSESVSMEKLIEQVSCLSVSLVNEGMNLEPQYSEASLSRNCRNQSVRPLSLEKSDIPILGSTTLVKEENSMIVLSDDDLDTEISANVVIHSLSNQLDCSVINNGASVISLQSMLPSKSVSSSITSADTIEVPRRKGPLNSVSIVSQKLESDAKKCLPGQTSLIEPKSMESIIRETSPNLTKNDSLNSRQKSKLKNHSDSIISKKIIDCFSSQSENSSSHKTTEDKRRYQGTKKVGEDARKVTRELVHDGENDPLELALRSAGRQQTVMSKVNGVGAKRRVIQLDLPVDNRYGYIHRPDGLQNRFKPPKLDNWYKPILELDYFASVGIAAPNEEESKTSCILKEVPVCFESPGEYVSIFQPLVLEEFKAQLQSSFMDMSFSEMHCGSLSVLSVERLDEFHIVRGVCDEIDTSGPKSCVENDLILLTKQQPQNGYQDVHIMGKVERLEKDSKRRSNTLVIRFYLQSGVSRLDRAKKLLLVRSKWFISRLLSITPQLREFQALSSIKNIPLLPIILNPISCRNGLSESRKRYLTKLSQPLQQILKASYNDSQVQAINSCIGSLDFNMDFSLSLVQGPPGTGKTRTIVAIVSGLLALHSTNDKKRENRSINSDTSSGTSLRTHISQSAAIARAWQDAAVARQLNGDEENNGKSMCSRRGRVLICAQSNAAVDELVSRICAEGLYGKDGLMYKPFLVRVGNAKTVHPNSLPYFIDTLVESRMTQERMKASVPGKDTSADSSTVLRSKLEKLVDRIQFYEAKRANLGEGSGSRVLSEVDGGVKEMSDAEIGARLRKLYVDKKTVYSDLAAAQVREKKLNEESRAVKHKLRKSILKEAEIVVTTLSGCGGDLYAVCAESISSHKFNSPNEHTLFDAVVIDEAAQALEPATLIPLQLLKSKGTKCIMVGDPKQLPATVISNVASKYLYQCSMFERLQRAGHPVLMLTKQELRGKNTGALSFYNEFEVDAAVEILNFFKQRYPSDFSGVRIGIVTPYKSQLSLLRSRISNKFGSSVTAVMEFNTVDGFQGREVDILILSTVRASASCSAEHKIPSGNIGFVADVRRMNVALTRAKFSLWILGNAKTLMTNKNWEALLKDAKKRNLVISSKKPYDSIFKSAQNDNLVLEYSDDHSVHLKHAQEDKEVGWHAEEQSRYAKSSYARKRRCTGVSALKNLKEDDRNTSLPREADKPNSTKAKSDHLSAKKVVKSNIAKDINSSIREHIKGDKSSSKINKDKQHNLGTSNSGGGEGSLQEINGIDTAVASDSKANKKRKQQRDAVDAILSSALISSKKSETSGKLLPSKRPNSQMSAKVQSFRPPKSR